MHSIFVKFIKLTYITVSNIIRSYMYVCPKVYDLGLKSLNITDVELCNIITEITTRIPRIGCVALQNRSHYLYYRQRVILEKLINHKT